MVETVPSSFLLRNVCAGLDQGNRFVRITTALHQAGHYLWQIFQTHENDDGIYRGQKQSPINFTDVMSGDDSGAGSAASVCHGDSTVSRRGNGRSDSGNDLVRHSGAFQCLCLFTAASKYERITAFEAHDDLTIKRVINK